MWTEKNIWIMSARGAFNLTSFINNMSSGFQAGPDCAHIVPKPLSLRHNTGEDGKEKTFDFACYGLIGVDSKSNGTTQNPVRFFQPDRSTGIESFYC